MSRKERKRLTVMAGVTAAELTLVLAAELMAVAAARASAFGNGIRLTGTRGWCLGGGANAVRRRKQVHRQWRERKPCFGAMVQLAGSHHDWFEGRGPRRLILGEAKRLFNFGRPFDQAVMALRPRQGRANFGPPVRPPVLVNP